MKARIIQFEPVKPLSGNLDATSCDWSCSICRRVGLPHLAPGGQPWAFIRNNENKLALACARCKQSLSPYSPESRVTDEASERQGVRLVYAERGDVNPSSLRKNKLVNNGERAGEASL